MLVSGDYAKCGLHCVTVCKHDNTTWSLMVYILEQDYRIILLNLTSNSRPTGFIYVIDFLHEYCLCHLAPVVRWDCTVFEKNEIHMYFSIEIIALSIASYILIEALYWTLCLHRKLNKTNQIVSFHEVKVTLVGHLAPPSPTCRNCIILRIVWNKEFTEII